MELKENPLDLIELDLNNSNVYKDGVYIYVSKNRNDNYSICQFHFRIKPLIDIFKADSYVNVKYLHPNHLFLTKSEKSDDPYNYRISNADKGDYRRNCFHFKNLAEKLKMKQLPPTKKNKRIIGDILDIEKYKFNKKIGYLVNISSFEALKDYPIDFMD